jgi:hypothetical protein
MEMTSPNLEMTSQDAGSGPRHLLLSCRGAGFPEREEIQRLIASHKVLIHFIPRSPNAGRHRE